MSSCAGTGQPPSVEASSPFESGRRHMDEIETTPMPATWHVAVLQERQEHGWWSMFCAWVKGMKR